MRPRTATCAARAAASWCSSAWRDAERDGDRILALIRGSAVNQDGRSGGLTVPNGPAQQAVLREALAQGGVLPRRSRLRRGTRNGHVPGRSHRGSGPGRGARRGPGPAHPLLLGSVKTNIGHLEAAAGMAGLIKVILALQHEESPAPPSLSHAEPAYSLAIAGGSGHDGSDALAGAGCRGASPVSARLASSGPTRTWSWRRRRNRP